MTDFRIPTNHHQITAHLVGKRTICDHALAQVPALPFKCFSTYTRDDDDEFFIIFTFASLLLKILSRNVSMMKKSQLSWNSKLQLDFKTRHDGSSSKLRATSMVNVEKGFQLEKVRWNWRSFVIGRKTWQKRCFSRGYWV